MNNSSSTISGLVPWLESAFVGLIFCLGMIIGCSQNPGPKPSSATNTEMQSDFDAEGVADLGYAEPGSTHELVYMIHTPDGITLSDLKLQSDCPCVEAIDLPETVEADEATPIRIRFKAPDKVLTYRQDLSVVSNASGISQQSQLTIVARLGLPLHAPDVVAYSAGEAATTFEVRNDGPEPVKLIYALSNVTGVKADVPREAIEPGKSCLVTVTSGTGWKQIEPTTLRIKTTHEAQPEIVVSVKPSSS